MPRPALALAAALLLAGCARDLGLPPQATGPRLTALAPVRAYAGQLVEIEGTGFADEPSANRVDFARASTQGLTRTATGLVVRVPPDAGSGPVTVSTSRGASEPFAGLEYLGLGQLRAGQVVQAVALLHRPGALFALDGDPVLDSRLYGGLVGTGAVPFVAPHAFQPPSAGGDSIYFVDDAPRLVRYRPGAGEVAAVALDASPNELCHLADATRPLLVTLASDAGADVLATYDAATLAPVMAPAALAVKAQSGLVDAGGGRVALLVEDGLGGLTLALVDPRGAAPVVTVLPAAPFALQASPAVLAAGTAGGAPVVAVAVEGGRVGLAALSPAPAWRPAAAGTSSSTAVGALTVAGDLVVAAKPDDGVVLGIDAAAAAVRWAFPLPRPSALAAGPGGTLWAAGEGDNVLVELDPARGVLLGRRAADALTTAASPVAGAAFRPDGAVAFAVARPSALVTWPLGGDAGAAVLPLAPMLVAWDPVAAGLWAGDAAAVSLGGAAPVAIPGGLSWLGVAAAGLVTTGGQLSLVRGGAVLGLATDLDAPLPPPALAGDGRLLAVGSMGGAERARLWSAEAVAGALPATVDVVLPDFGVLGAFIDGEPWVSWSVFDPTDNLLRPHTARLGADGALTGEVAAGLPEGLTSPNGRTVVVPDLGLLGGLSALRVVALEPGAGFPTVDRIELPAPIVGMAFDATGERLFVVTRGPDQLLALE